MTFDLTTLLFQLANFALLVVLLRLFLYRPVLEVMDQRAEATAAPLREARRLVEEAEQEREALRLERAAYERDSTERLAALEREMERRRQQRLDELEREVQAKRSAAMESIDRAVERATERLTASLANLVVAEVRHSLSELAGADLDEAVWARFEQRLRDLSDEERAALAAGARATGVRVITPRPLPDKLEERVRQSLTSLLGAEHPLPAERVTFAVDDELILGIALEAGGLRIDGTASARLEALEATFHRVLEGELS